MMHFEKWGVKLPNLLFCQMKLLLRKEWRLPESAAQKSCEVFLRQFRLRPDHSELELDAWRTFLWVSALGDYQHLAGLFV